MRPTTTRFRLLLAAAVVAMLLAVTVPAAADRGLIEVLGQVSVEPLPTVTAPARPMSPEEQASEVDTTEILVTDAAHQAVTAAVLRTAPLPVDIIAPDPHGRPQPNALFLRARDGSGVINVYTQTRLDGQVNHLEALSAPGARSSLDRPDPRTEVVVNDHGDGRPQQVIAFHNRLMVNMITNRGVPGMERGAAVDGATLRAWVDAVLADPAVQAASLVPLPDVEPLPDVSLPALSSQE